MDGYCLVTDGHTTEPFSLMFDDGKPFEQADVAIKLPAVRQEIPSGSLVLEDHLATMGSIKPQVRWADYMEQPKNATSTMR
jgi:hypothetical protein